MGDMTAWVELAKQFGSGALLCAVGWKLADKWLGLFLAAQKEQTAAMANQATSIASLVDVVRSGQTDQHEVLLAVRVQSRQIEEMKDTLSAVAGQLGGRK